MPKYIPKAKDYLIVEKNKKKTKVLSKKAYDAFNTSVLGLGDIRKSSEAKDAIAGMFDLEGFTNFCKQIEPHLSVPLFLSEFLEWLLRDIKNEMSNKNYKEGVSLWCPLPFFVKFMGDGLLVLWDSSATSDVGRRNILLSAYQICKHYKSTFLPSVRKKVSAPPSLLRCGLARGTVYSVGDGSDYVGSCINMAARLQKVPGATFAFNKRGFDIENKDVVEFFKKNILIKRMSIRGIGNDELVGILEKEYSVMSAKDKKQFQVL